LPSALAIILPITTRERSIAFHLPVNPPEGGLRTRSYVLADQPRTVSTSRFIEQWGAVTNETLRDARQLVSLFLEG
jgi:mRNA interferase MazF